MSGHFEALPGGGAAVPLDEVEVAILRSLAVQMLELIGPGDQPAQGEDPLAALFRDGPSEPPSDPALARLFPEAYGDGDDEARAASAEFRRFTENDLRTRKREDALTVVRSLDRLTAAGGPGGRLELDVEESRGWLGALNDLRLTIGTRLEVGDEDESSGLYRLPDSDPRKPMVMAYLWLGALQETLVETLMP
ncbi:MULTISPECIES: DUF2017 domain-containing protein [Streptomyces]|uniref:Uncharacterized protein n=2 Tax=Streptomyces TaxID=1883 RepID=A0A117IUQ2_9ACTN|nr:MULTISPECIES: DUF2017 domain-containing protein [Streptomyces]KUH35228.1 hypothetical protein ATE80_30460 [Streptomyces kanasensis]UUS31282.1 DUF2017 domain-containing protein [Streptomyces changanensis]